MMYSFGRMLRDLGLKRREIENVGSISDVNDCRLAHPGLVMQPHFKWIGNSKDAIGKSISFHSKNRGVDSIGVVSLRYYCRTHPQHCRFVHCHWRSHFYPHWLIQMLEFAAKCTQRWKCWNEHNFFAKWYTPSNPMFTKKKTPLPGSRASGRGILLWDSARWEARPQRIIAWFVGACENHSKK